MGLPWLGASASLTLRGIKVLNTWSPKKSLRSSRTWRERLVRSSNIVNRIPSIASFGLWERRTGIQKDETELVAYRIDLLPQRVLAVGPVNQFDRRPHQVLVGGDQMEAVHLALEHQIAQGSIEH